MSDTDEQDFTAWMDSNEMDRVREYLARGRFHSRLTDKILFEEWITVAKAWCMDATSDEKRLAEHDLKAELHLRGLGAPFYAIDAELKILHRRFGEWVDNLIHEDPEEFSHLNAQLAGLVDDFLSRKAAQQN